MGSITKDAWKPIAARKQQERESAIPKQWRISEHLIPAADAVFVQDFPEKSGMFSERELRITEATASEIVASVAAAEWTALEVAEAVCKRAAVAQQLVNCLTEIFFEDALARARELDEFFRREGRTVGPLHGLPISLKDQFNVEGYDSTIGYASYAGKPMAEDSTLVALLRQAGAVLYCKTNVPATLMMGETVNNVFGRTVNPRNRGLSTGGSSGGESALVGFFGSPLGLGTDIGGSVRHPCSYTGLFGLRPSHGRVSYQGLTNTFLGQEAVRSCIGPMCRSPEDVELFMATVAGLQPWLLDPQSLPMPWRVEAGVLPEKLCFGFGMGDGSVTPTPPVRRAMEIAKAKLEAAGHRVIDFTPHENADARNIINRMWTADGGEEVRRDSDLSGEPLPARVEDWLGHSSGLKPATVFETWQNQQHRALLAQSWLARWQATASDTGTGRPIDALIVPSSPFPAPKHEQRFPYSYGGMAPLLDLTSGVFPVTKVDVVADVLPPDWQPISERDKEIMDYYKSPKEHEHALIGLGLVGKRLEEEKMVALLKLMRDVVGVDYGSRQLP